MRVEIYRNLQHKYKKLDYPVYSVCALDGAYKGLVVAHVREAKLLDAEFRVGQAGRLRVIREQSKNVHAKIRGELVGVSSIVVDRTMDNDMSFFEKKKDLFESSGTSVYYNPYKVSTFVDPTGKTIDKAGEVIFNGNGVFAIDVGRLSRKATHERARASVNSWPSWKRDFKLTEYS